MTVSSTTTRVTYTGNGVTTAFATTFPFFAADEIEVIERVIATGAETVKTLTTDYTVSGGNGATGTVTAAGGAPSSAVQWIIRRRTARTQEIDYTPNDPFPAETHEEGLDRLKMNVQELGEEQGRSLKFPKTDSAGLSGVIPSSVTRAGKFLAFDGDGAPVVTAGTADSTPHNEFMIELHGASNAGDARDVLGAGTGDVASTRTISTTAPLSGGGDLSGNRTLAFDIAVLRSYLAGLALSNNATDANNDIDVVAGVAVDTTNAYFIKLASAITKRLDAAWAVGTNQGGLDTGSKANTTWYHVWLIARSDTGVVDVLFSTSATAPTMPTSYDYKRLIGSVLTDGSGNIIAFKQTGDWFQWVTSIHDVNDATGHTTSRSLRTLSIPPGRKCRVKIRAYVPDSSSNHSTVIQDPDETDAAPNVTMTPPGSILASATGAFAQLAQLEVMTNTSSQIASRCSAASKPLDIITVGYVDRRGRDD